MIAEPEFAVAVDAGDILGESPVWDSRAQCLYWVDIRRQLVHQWGPSTNFCRSWSVEETVGSLGLRESAGLVVALRSGIATLDTASGASTFLTRAHIDQPDMRFNDGRCDRTGAFWVGSMNDRTRAAEGCLYRLDSQYRWKRMLTGLRVPNSLCWSPDSSVMYFSDSRAHTIWAFSTDVSGEIGDRRVFATIEPPAVPDGATVDCEGFVWCALARGAAVARFAPDGRTDRIIRLPVQLPTSCAFGGVNLDTLFVTTASEGLDVETRRLHPLAGSVLSFNPGVRGSAEPRFAG